MAGKERKEGKEGEGILTMCVTNGLFVIGKLVGGNKLIQPRVFDLYMEQLIDSNGRPILDQSGKPKFEERIRMRPFPGVPGFCTIGPDAIRYPVVTNMQNVLSLYERVTAGTPVTDPLPPPAPPGGSGIIGRGSDPKLN
uniref:Uncharacterized protein n=1 Tax=viral metagenome TaxID=1070528 RepID=A0A6M3JJ73_9ZZZZ